MFLDKKKQKTEIKTMVYWNEEETRINTITILTYNSSKNGGKLLLYANESQYYGYIKAEKENNKINK